VLTREASRERILALPKPELHVHLDGSLRPSTMLELARERDIPLPADDEAGLRERLVASDAGSLEDYLTAFDATLSVMQDAEAIDRIAFELGEDHARENVRYAEVRFCPLLNTHGGLRPDQVLEAALAGLGRADTTYGTRSAVIVCALRHLPPSTSVSLAELAVHYREHGVCGFDLAGAEAGHPVRAHAEAFALAHTHALPITIHAGEAFGPESIRQALEKGHASRIGHGTRLGDDPDLLEHVRDAGVTLEVCLTSNVQTRAVSSYEVHPLRSYYDAGVSVVLSTDNRLVSGVTLTDEYGHARDALGFSWDELVSLARNGFSRAFAAPEVRAALVGTLDERVSRLA
jgi:adenosine deaminase